MMTFKTTIQMVQEDYRSGTSSLILLDEDYKTVPSGIIFKNFSPYLEIYNEMLGWLESNGLTKHWAQEFYGYTLKKVEDIGPQVLTMDHLKIGFVACIIPLVLSAFIFVAEHVWSRFK